MVVWATHQEDKSMSINEEGAETVRYIFDHYIQGYGAYTIAKELEKLGKKNKNGNTSHSNVFQLKYILLFVPKSF